MDQRRFKHALEKIAQRDIPEHVDLWPRREKRLATGSPVVKHGFKLRRAANKRQIILAGEGEIADICRLTCLEMGIEIVADDPPDILVREHLELGVDVCVYRHDPEG